MWSAYQLAKAGFRTTMVACGDDERGGLQGASRRAAGAFNLSLVNGEKMEAMLQEIGCGQTHPSVARTLSLHLSSALRELGALMELKPVKIGMALASGNGEQFLEQIRRRFGELGGEMIDGWVTRLAADAGSCRGLQYECREGAGKLRCKAMVLAPGGYAGLFANAVKTHCCGNVLGYYLQCGGIATNLEFLFKHGYGNMEANELTPTEELPGAEIYDARSQRVEWLEQMLFNRQGTNSHLQAVQFWLRNPEAEFYVDLSHRPLYLKLQELNGILENGEKAGHHFEAEKTLALAGVADLFPKKSRMEVFDRISGWIASRRVIDYAMFEELKHGFKPAESLKFRVQPLTYFSMGGMGHLDFSTNLKNVFVTGEAMHDFGANRVGGLPWSLYLSSAYVIREQMGGILGENGDDGGDFEMTSGRSHYDPGLLGKIQQRLHDSQERELTASRAMESIDWFRRTRGDLLRNGGRLDDGVAWLIVAEAIMQCSLCRTESRGFFFRHDFQNSDERLERLFSCAWYDRAADEVAAELLPWDRIEPRLRHNQGENKPELACATAI